jgi:alpha-ketoglutaric semialdehyde dehydrogenase
METSVGANAIDRFLRPICYEHLPHALLSAEIRQATPPRLWRRVDGELKKA